ncbi:hypothetical protein BC936DRAFT_144458, partial [Jimgerdemannia flammicorona]
ASIVGKYLGRHRWPGTNKTVEGTAAYVASVLLGSVVIAWVATRVAGMKEVMGAGAWVRYAGAVGITG